MAKRRTSTGDPSDCPCGSKQRFIVCCQSALDGTEPAATAAALMRSRYTAFTRGDAEYLLRSWHPDTRPPELTLDEHQKWLGLRIKNTEAGLATDSEGQVEFVARYRRDGRGHRLHELSQFKKINGLWFYHSGVLHEP